MEKFRIKNNKNIKYFKSIFKFKIYNSYFYLFLKLIYLESNSFK
jgi:hypothetical protein